MKKPSAEYICNQCGAVFGKWAGRCGECGEWNTLEEQEAGGSTPKGLGKGRGRKIELTNLAKDVDGEEAAPQRIELGNNELARVLGGGLVPGSALLVGGDPGIGKSTLFLQLSADLASSGHKAIYISGEEARSQIRMRAERLGLKDAHVLLASATNLRDILSTLGAEAPALVIIDSIQTIWSDMVDAAPGTVSQLRAVVHELVGFAKRSGAAMVLVGHVTKDGQIAGPRLVEHMVDTVLYFEGDRGHHYRLLRAVKNRFGMAGEIGVFEMQSGGLVPVENPSSLFLSSHNERSPGAAVFAGIEGSRPLLVEIQALIAPSPYATPRRAVIGWDSARLSMILAVLEARAGVEFGPSDIYLNIAGGLRIFEPAADLAVAAALISAHLDRPLPQASVFFGEISLSGAIRPVPMADARLREAKKLGFERAITPSELTLGEDSPLALSSYPRLEEFIEIALKR